MFNITYMRIAQMMLWVLGIHRFLHFVGLDVISDGPTNRLSICQFPKLPWNKYIYIYRNKKLFTVIGCPWATVSCVDFSLDKPSRLQIFPYVNIIYMQTVWYKFVSRQTSREREREEREMETQGCKLVSRIESSRV